MATEPQIYAIGTCTLGTLKPSNRQPFLSTNQEQQTTNCHALRGKSFYELRTTNYELFYPKQTQFAGYPNERNFCYTKELRRKSAANPPKNKPNQTQFKPRSLLPEGSWRPKMNVTKVLTTDYENKRLHRRAENKPNFTPHSVPYRRARTILPVGNLPKGRSFLHKCSQFSHKNFSVIPLRQNLQLRGPFTNPPCQFTIISELRNHENKNRLHEKLHKKGCKCRPTNCVSIDKQNSTTPGF